jgi:NADH:ubiquinone oxidoreductase subunit
MPAFFVSGDHWTFGCNWVISGQEFAERDMGILNKVLRVFTWWNGQTLNTQIYTWRKGVKVGEDAQGNVFYSTKDDKRRWVIFNGEIEASKVDADWHGWLHHTFKESPSERPMAHKTWEKPHQENRTGSALAYAPAGSLRQAKPKARDDYEAWKPE